MVSHVFHNSYRKRTKKNVVFSPPVFPPFFATKREKKNKEKKRKKWKNRFFCYKKQFKMLAGKKSNAIKSKIRQKNEKNVGRGAERSSETEIPHRHAAPRSAAGWA